MRTVLDEVGAGAERDLVRGDVLRAIARDRLARSDRRRLDRRVGDDERAVGVAAAHHAAVEPEKADVASLERGRARDDLRGELHTLTADAGDEQLTLHDDRSS